MKWLRVRRLKPLCLALLCLALVPPLIEFGLRVAACRQDSQDDSGIVVVPCWQMHHRLHPMQSRQVAHGESGQSIEFRTNSLGLRGREPGLARPPDVFRIVCLGDETLLAPDLNEAETFPARLAERLPRYGTGTVEVINGGVPGYCPLLSWLQLRHQLMALDPDLIIVLFDMTDVAEDLSYRRFTETSSGGRPLAAIHPSLTQSQQSKSIQDNFVSWQLAQEALTNVFSDQPPDAARQPVDPRTQYAWLTDESTAYDRFVELALSPVQSIRDVARNRGIPVLLAAHPAPWQVSGTASPGARDVRLNGISRGQVIASRRPFALLAQFASEIGLPFCDASTDFLSSRDPDRLFQHQTRGFTAAGTELYARAIVRSLLQSVPGPWESNSGRQNEYERGTVTPVGGGRNKRGDLNEIMQIPTRDAFDNDLAPVPGHR